MGANVTPPKISPRILPEGLDFRTPQEGDTERIIELSRVFFAESAYPAMGLEFSEEIMRAFLYELFRDRMAPAIVATIDDRVVGFVTLGYEFAFSTKPVAILQYIFVEKPYRRTLIARTLIQLAMKLAQDDGAAVFFAPVNSGSRNIGSLANMLRKQGFQVSGYISTRRL